MRRTLPRTVILASAIAAASSPVHAARGAAWGPRVGAEDRSQAFVTEGDAAFERGDYEEAISKYRAAYYGLDSEQRTSYLGSLPVRNAMRAYTLLLAERQDRVVLERQLAFLAEFLESVAAQDGGAEKVGAEVMAELEAVRADVQLKLARLSEVVAPPPSGAETAPSPNLADGSSQGTATEAAEPEPGASLGSIDSLAPPPGRDPLGLGLAIGGGVAMGIGAGVMVGWWTVRRQADAEADRVFGSDPSPARSKYLREEWYHARRYLIAGSTIAGLGLAIATTGAVLLVVRRTREPRAGMALRLVPAMGPQGAALRLSGRF